MLVASAAFSGPEFTNWSVARRLPLPAELAQAGAADWNTWARKQDQSIRARLAQGDLDSMVNLLLFGTSFTKQPRIKIEDLTEASRSGILRRRVDDLIAGLRRPGDNERLLFLRGLLRRNRIDADAAPADAGVFVYKNLQRVLEERRSLAQRAAGAKQTPASLLDRSSLFSDRGVSLDTSILPNFAIDQTLRDLKTRGLLHAGQILRVAVAGPGLDFSDKNEESSYDYYPQQTVQPFALYDSLLRLELATPGTFSLTVLDISDRVLSHLERAREKATAGAGYLLQLPRDVARPWPPALVDYWKSFGNQIGTAVAPIQPPQIFTGLETRAVEVRPKIVLALQPVNLDIILQRLDTRFDLVVATNIFVYYGAFEQALALENIGAMLKPGGFLLTNDQLPETPGGSMKHAGTTLVRFVDRDPAAVEAIGWYRPPL